MQKFIVYLLYKIEDNVRRAIAIAIALLVLLLLAHSTTWFGALEYGAVANVANRGATTVSSDVFGDNFSKVVYLSQGWDETDSLWFYNTTQGSDLLPYDFFVALEQDKSQEPFHSPVNMNQYRYLPQAASRGNPDGLPVGMVADQYCGKKLLGLLEEKYCGKKYLGFTCAACHSSQVNYKGVGIRIDGGPGAADMDGFMHGLEDSLTTTLQDPGKKQRFVAAVLNRCTFMKTVSFTCDYRNEKDVEDDLKTYALRLKAYNFFNESIATDQKGTGIPVHYGYARLDAFGRIYNRVLEHVMNRQALQALLTPVLKAEELTKVMGGLKSNEVLSAEDRDHVEEQLVSLLPETEQGALRAEIFNSPNAPVSYPFLWDIPQHDFVQWNGIGANAGAGPLGRNTGEVIGVFATLDWEETQRWMPAPLTSWLGLGPKGIRFQSSTKAHNLQQIEDRLNWLNSPRWEDAVKQAGLPVIDAKRAAHGAQLFSAQCVSCHAPINTTDPSRRIVAEMEKLDVVGTDPTMANNSVNDMGYSGILRNQYTKTDVGSVLVNTRAPVAAILIKATENVVATPDPDKWFFTRWADWAVDLIRGLHSNPVKASVKEGNYTPDTTAAPFSSLLAYKGRPLDGIWATAPYLHNGSVPTLYDLLLPASPQKGDPPGTRYRTKTFMVGSRELDPDKVGFRNDENLYPPGSQGFRFDTSLPGNSNAGHEYGTRKMSEQDRLDLVEFIKTL